MKKKFGSILTIISVVIAMIYFITINISFDRMPKIIDIEGNKDAIGDTEFVAIKYNDRYTTSVFNIGKDSIDKEGSYYDFWNYLNKNVKEDKRFYRNASYNYEEIYESEDSRFSAAFDNRTRGSLNRIINISYRNKKTNEYTKFDVTVQNWCYIYGVYSNGEDQKIIVEGSDKLGQGNIIVADVDLENKTITPELEINLSEQSIYNIGVISENFRAEFNAGINDNILYLTGDAKDTGLKCIVGINITNGNVEKYEYKINDDKAVNRGEEAKLSDGYIDTYYYYDTLDLIRFNIETKSFEEYKGIKIGIDPETKYEERYIDKVAVKDNKLFYSYNRYSREEKNTKIYIGVVDLSSNKNLYLGEVIGSYVTRINTN